MHPLLFHFGSILIPSYGVFVALAVLLALAVSLWSASKLELDGNEVWNLGVLGVFTALVSSRIFLVLLNLKDFRQTPLWLLGLATLPNDLLLAAGLVMGVLVALLYARWRHLSLLSLADCLGPALAVGYAVERIGCFLAGSAYGVPTKLAWAVVYHSHLAEEWSGTPLGTPVHPVQLYEAVLQLLLGTFLLWRLKGKMQKGELAGLWVFGTGFVHYLCELFRGDPGRKELLGGFLTLTQVLAISMVLAGGFLLRKRDTVIS